MSTITISNADWEALEAVPLSAVTIDAVSSTKITISVDLGSSQSALFQISGTWSGVSGISLAGLVGTVSGISMSINGVSQFDATGLAIDVTEITEEVLSEVGVLVELALGEDAEIIGSDDDDSLGGTAGNDSVSGNLGDDDLFGDLGDDSLSGGDGLDSLDGGDGNDTLNGGVGDDSLTGGNGNDKLYAGGGQDYLDGGVGNDTYYVDAADTIVELSAGGTDTEVASFSDTLDDINIENLTLTGSAGLSGTGNKVSNILTGNAGSNTLSGLDGHDKLSGGDGNDTLMGGVGDDTLLGGTGSDRLYAGTGTDSLSGGVGNDVYYVDAADTIVELSDGGIDTEVARFSDTLDDIEIENLTLTGSAGLSGTGNAANNVLTGNAGSNTLSGLGGYDKLSGGDGNDTLMGGVGNDTLLGGTGSDRLYAGTGTDSLSGGVGNDVYYVDAADTIVELSDGGIDTEVASFSDTLDDIEIENLTLTGSAGLSGTGNAANNVLTGNAGSNTLSGLDGHDLLRGGAGNDVLTGGAGFDKFRFDSALSSGSVVNVDQITDFSVSDDTIQLAKSIFTAFGTTTSTLAAGQLALNITGLAVDVDDRIIYETDTGKLFYDADGSGNGTAVQIAILGTQLQLTATDFVLI